VEASPKPTDDLADASDAFSAARRRLFGVAYRMLSSAAEAEDIVQEAWLRWQTTDRSAVLDPTAFLVTITTRLAMNQLQSARARRESYVGLWLPEPIDTSDDADLGAARGEALELAVLVLLEKLTPAERAAYVLREAFEYEYADIAEILQLSEANTRQIITRARKHIADERRAQVGAGERQRLLEAFIGAAQRGDRAGLEALLAADVVSRSDGGGVVRVAPIPVEGRDRVARFVASVASRFWNDVEVAITAINGRVAAVLTQNGAPYGCLWLETSTEGITEIAWQLNPQKLGGVASVPRS
jgi:RNA polymerase sigma-70 factor, ECF subfamily